MYVRKTKDIVQIIGSGPYGNEVIDEFDTFREARAMLVEYRIAFAGSMSLTLKSKREKL